jgi:hypothetical protein
MQKITFIILLGMVSLVGKAAVYLDETFNYTESNLANETSWTNTGTITTGSGRSIETGGLVFSNAGGTYINSGIGKKINQDYSAGSNYIAYKTIATISSGVIYLSYLYKPNGDQGQAASEVLGLSSSNTNSAVKIWAGKQADGTKNPYRIGLTRSSTSSNDIIWSTSTYSTSDVLLIVIKYDFTTYAATLYINPIIASASEPSPVAIAATDGTTRTSLINLMFKHNGSSVANFFVSGVRVSSTWAEAVQSAAPQLSTPTVNAADNFTATGFTANWNTVTNAIGYSVMLYKDGIYENTYNVDGQMTTYLGFSGLTAGKEYTYTVKALGDGVNYSHSDASAFSSAYTTSTPALLTAFDIRSTGFTSYWKPTTNTTSYEVKVYQDNDLISTINVSGQTSASTIITNLQSGLKYTYTVTSSDGFTSASSAPITTLTPTILETFSDWNVQASAGTYSITKNLYDGISSGTFSSNSLIVAPAQSIGSNGIASGNGRPTAGRIQIGGAANYIQLPVISTISTITCKNHAGTNGSGYKLQSSNNGIDWADIIGATVSLKNTVTEAITFNINSSSPIYLRMLPLQGGGIYFWDIQVNPYIPPAKLSAPIVHSASNINATNFTANWETVENALGYYIKVYQGGNYISTMYVDGQSSTNGEITGLLSNTNYTFKVIAKANISTFSSSDASSFSELFTTTYDYSISTNVNSSSLGSLNGNSSVLVSSNGTFTIDQNTTVNSITVAPGAKVTLADTKTLSGALSLQSDASGTATFVDENTEGSTVNAIVEQYMPQGRNWYVGSPVIEGNSSSLMAIGTGSSVSYYSESTSSWVNNYSGNLDPGSGYISISNSGTAANNINFAGTLVSGEVNVSLTRQGSIQEGFNLVGNPYSSYLNAMVAINANNELESTIWYRTRSTGGSPVYYFETVNTISGLGTNNAGTGTVTGYIPPMQAFWVRTASNTYLTFNNSMRYHAFNTLAGETSVPTTLLKAPSSNISPQKLLRIKVSNNKNSNETILYFNDNASDGYDVYDSKKMSNDNPDIPEIFTIAENRNLVINGMNQIPLVTELPLHFVQGNQSNFTLRATEFSNFDASVRVILRDKFYENLETDITNGADYNFMATSENSTERFSIIFRSTAISTSIENSETLAFSVVNMPNRQLKLLFNQNVTGQAILYNMIGQIVINQKVHGESEFMQPSLQPGIYIFNLQHEGKTISKKVIVE